MNYENLLDELYILTEKENTCFLTEPEKQRYLTIVEVLHEAEIEIPFGIEI